VREHKLKLVKVPNFLIVGDHDTLRALLHDWVEMNFPQSHVLQATKREEGIHVARSMRPEVILFDCGMDMMYGIEAIQTIKQAKPDVKIVVLSMHENHEYRVGAMTAGASAYILKCEMGARLMSVLRDLLSHDPGFSEQDAEKGRSEVEAV